MKTGRLFWGLFFVGVGLLVFGEKFDLICVQWSVAWKLWPVVLLIWGAALLIGGVWVRRIAAGAAALALAYLVVAVFSFSWVEQDWHSGPITESKELIEPYDSTVHRVAFSLESGAGVFSLGDTTSDLLAIKTETDFGSYVLDKESAGEVPAYTLALEGRKKWRLGSPRNRVDVRLNPAPLWDLELDVGAAKLRCDLSALAVAQLDVNTGATSMDIRLGDRVPDMEVRINAGVSTIRVSVPEQTGCEVFVDTKLTSKNLSGFTRHAERTYRTENYESATRKITIDVDAGVSSITIDRY